MSYISIVGGNRIEGEVLLQGSKNAALPVLAAAVLCRGTVRIKNCPDISDVRELLHALSYAGVESSWNDDVLELESSHAVPVYFGPELAGKTRGGVLLLGAFLGRFKEAGMAYPGGCVIGARPIDLHCKLFRELHLSLTEGEEGVVVKGTPKGERIVLLYPSVGATENAVLAAVCGEGRTEIIGAAREPEVAELCCFLKKAGADIRGVGTSHLVIEGVSCLHGVDYTLVGDRIAAGTYMAAAMITGGEVLLRRTDRVCMKGIFEPFYATGAQIHRETDLIFVRAPRRLHSVRMWKTAPFPGFPTDMQSQMVALLSVAEGDSRIYETVFESRFGVLPELRKMGAGVSREKQCILIRGKKTLYGATVEASDLRSGAALVLAALKAEGESRIYGYDYIARGYERFCETLQGIGAKSILREE